MLMNSQQIIARIGETDQLYLSANSPELALERGDLRLQLVTLSHNRQEQLYFLHEALAILEQGRVEFEEIPMQLYINLSLQLAKAYMIYFELNQDSKFALITQQILKPLAHLAYGDIYFFLAYAAIVKKEHAMTKHWLRKYVNSSEYDHELLHAHPQFKPLHQEVWFIELVKKQLH
ncbi:hypothetical protein LVY74_17515 [Acinetobacter sp. ME22]|uniref:hypothetical protein n=1 Tax=Acinetobacter sp. ME22 TaxID=2904802 RepID=UPI001EDAE66A|nr:hypothetical protein [Acinetobacter sp. ME22]MCG2575331.1 hypothetical protein [Acinetobacter sp. ME22]